MKTRYFLCYAFEILAILNTKQLLSIHQKSCCLHGTSKGTKTNVSKVGIAKIIALLSQMPKFRLRYSHKYGLSSSNVMNGLPN